MKKHILIGAGLLLSTAGIGVALAASGFDLPNSHPQERHDSRATADAKDHLIRTAEETRDRDHGGGHHDRTHADDREDDDDGDDDDGGARGRAAPQNSPSGSSAPVPDNGLFNGKTPPKVEVQ